MRNLPIDVLRTFVTVAELGSFTQAGELLGRSQPAISLQIKRLEEQIEASLFTRKGHQLGLTSSGSKLLKYALEILALNDKVIAEFKQPSLTGRVRFGIPSEFATTLLPKILGNFTQSYPGVNLEINCELSKNLLSQPADQYDLVLALQDKSPRKLVSRIKEDELVWVSGSIHDIHLQSPLRLVLAPEPCIYRARALERLNSLGCPWQIAYTNTDLTGIQTAIEEGLGVTVLAKSTVPKSLRVLPKTDKFPRLGKVDIHLYYDKRTANNALLRLVDYIRISI
ncbi:LysR family transcriptional regulator [Kineobactrum sediminis]|uniref:LysR family transcriptional regulator n=1 Tax=Kineobactrum sediminis TaxID=1905677 RepID=A0A2N5XZ54_9GAMM|nr:LysR substrate-binding domain-containing protein [Kineobactrum sediminis]PLW81413.1 LysR family transcriptional regulator [Kineobactrum sediminis]